MGNRSKRRAVTIVIDGVGVGALPDAAGYARGLERFDAWLERFMTLLTPGTLLAITRDHGCDPTMPGSDHTREYVPLLAAITGVRRPGDLGTRATFGDLAATLAEFFGLMPGGGESFLDSLER